MNWFKKLFTRQTEAQALANEDRTFVPLGSGGASYGSVYSPALAKCLALYVDNLIACPVKCSDENDNFYKNLLQKEFVHLCLTIIFMSY